MRTIRLASTTEELTFIVDHTGVTTNINGALLSVSGLDVSTYRPRLGIQSRYGKSGGVATGDREVDPREISIAVDLTATTDYQYVSAMETILGLFRVENAPFYLYDDQDDSNTGGLPPRRTQIELKSEDLSTNGKGNERRVMSGKIVFSMLDGLWEDQIAKTYESGSGGISNNSTFTLSNTSKRRAYPVYTITALSNNSLFRLTNTQTDVFIEIGTSDFTIGTDCVIDTVNGTITIDGVNIIASSLSDGSSMPDIVPGDNEIRYESDYGACEIQVEWRQQYPR